MNDIVQNVLGVIVITFSNVFIWVKLLSKRPNFKKLETYIILILMSITTVVNYFYTNQFLRILIITILMIIFLKFLLKDNLKNTAFAVIISQMIYMVSEMIFAFGLICIFNVNPDEFVELFFGKFLTNFIISLIAICISQFKFVKKIYNLLLNITDKIKVIHLMIMLLVAMLIANIYAGIIYYDYSFIYIMIFNTLLTVLFFILVINSFYNRNKYIKAHDKYNTTLSSLKEYEDILNKYRILNHENKNQLLTIRNMSKNKKIHNYIDQLIDNKIKDDEKLLYEVAIIPQGGLRGVIYSKMLFMKTKNINYELYVDKEIRTADLINFDDGLMLDVCKIIGVYIDNAIEAVENLEDKYVEIDLYIEDHSLNISISNNYYGKINLNKINQIGYTTKGTGHGYGLPLVNQIIEKNKKLSNNTNINSNVFTQILKIKM